MIELGKVKWHREYELEHYLYILSATYGNVRIELAGIEWDYGSSDGGWHIAQVGSIVPLVDGYGSIGGKNYTTATRAKTAAVKLLRRILKAM